MNNNHPDEITLLRLAFPQKNHPVEEHWAWHALLCKQCSEHILTMRKMRELQAKISATQVASPAPSPYSPPSSLRRAVAAGVVFSTVGGGSAISVAYAASESDSPLAEMALLDDVNEDVPVPPAASAAPSELDFPLAFGSDIAPSLTGSSMVDVGFTVENDWVTPEPEFFPEPPPLQDFDNMDDSLL